MVKPWWTQPRSARGHQAPAPSRQVHAESGLKFPVLDPRGIDQQTRAHLLNMKSHSRPEQVPLTQGLGCRDGWCLLDGNDGGLMIMEVI